jgi:hypothetical protein
MTPPASPYANKIPGDWSAVTQGLVAEFPLDTRTLVEVVKGAWHDLYSSQIGKAQLMIGRDVFLPAQATGVILERLIAHELKRRDARWQSGVAKADKDVTFKDNPRYCFEIKTSSSKSGLYGNRSTGHRAEGRQKYRTGYYLVVNYKLPTPDDGTKWIWRIRFGWIDDEDWTGQAQPTGQQASVSREVARGKLITLFSSNGE